MDKGIQLAVLGIDTVNARVIEALLAHEFNVIWANETDPKPFITFAPVLEVIPIEEPKQITYGPVKSKNAKRKW